MFSRFGNGRFANTVNRLSQRVVTMETKPVVIFVLGAPGSGKGTQSANIVKEFGFLHMSAGDLLRAERSTGSEHSALINTYIKNGDIVPVEITVKLLEKAMKANKASKVLIDGFPRNKDNLMGWKKLMDDTTDVKFVLFLDCSQSVCVARCLERGKTSCRSDDNEESLKKRFVMYVEHTKPIVDLYSEKGMVRTVKADVGVDEVFEEVKKIFKSEGF